MHDQLGELLRARAERIPIPAGDLNEVLTAGRRRLFLRRMTAVLGVAALVALALVLVRADLFEGNLFEGKRQQPAEPFKELPGNGVLIGHDIQIHGAFVYQPDAAPWSDFSWDPDGVLLAYEADGEVRTINVKTGEQRRMMFCNRCTFAWAPDGERIAIASSQGLHLLDADRLTSARVETPGVKNVRQPTWSPDGGSIAFVAEGDDRPGLFRLDFDEARLTVLWVAATPDAPAPFDPAWSPAGGRIVFIHGEPVNDRLRLSLATVDPDGDHFRRVASMGTCYCAGFTPGVAWSPDGTTIAINQEDGLFEMAADGTASRRVADNSSGALAWQPIAP